MDLLFEVAAISLHVGVTFLGNLLSEPVLQNEHAKPFRRSLHFSLPQMLNHPDRFLKYPEQLRMADNELDSSPLPCNLSKLLHFFGLFFPVPVPVLLLQ